MVFLRGSLNSFIDLNPRRIIYAETLNLNF